jgi:hypothetical protein
MRIIITPDEVATINKFCEAVTKKIDKRDFFENKNKHRTTEKAHEDSFRAKCSELAVSKILQNEGIHCDVDFNIYARGIGDAFDIVTDGASVDVKASSPRARNLMIEKAKIVSWKERKVAPNYLCMVSVEEVDGTTVCEYMFGISMKNFKDNAKLFKRGQQIPMAPTILKADNFIVSANVCEDVSKFINYMKERNNANKLNMILE